MEGIMQSLFTFLQSNPYFLLFLVVGLAVWIGRASIKGYGLGMVAGAIIVGAALSVIASLYGV
jgi:putative transport protein